MSINAISFSGGWGLPSSISEETRRRLIALGIDPSTVTSEAQAQILIENALKLQKVSKSEKGSSLKICPGELELITRAKKLAQKLELRVSDMTPIEQIFTQISEKIESLHQSDDIKECKVELSELKNEYSTLKANENAMYASMNFSANMNRMILGI